MCGCKKDLRRTIPPCCNIVSQVFLTFAATDCTRETEITQFDGRVRIDENIRRLQITVDNPRGMKILQCAKQLPCDEAVMHVHQDVRTDHAVKISVHQLKHKVDVPIIHSSMHSKQ
jgi:hypothetical protein